MYIYSIFLMEYSSDIHSVIVKRLWCLPRGRDIALSPPLTTLATEVLASYQFIIYVQLSIHNENPLQSFIFPASLFVNLWVGS